MFTEHFSHIYVFVFFVLFKCANFFQITQSSSTLIHELLLMGKETGHVLYCLEAYHPFVWIVHDIVTVSLLKRGNSLLRSK